MDQVSLGNAHSCRGGVLVVCLDVFGTIVILGLKEVVSAGPVKWSVQRRWSLSLTPSRMLSSDSCEEVVVFSARMVAGGSLKCWKGCPFFF